MIGWVSALDVLASPGRFALSVVFALGVKAAEGVAIACVQAAFGLSVTPASTMLVLAALSISSLVPLTPANVGAFEAATYAAYVALGVDRDKALGIALVQHATMLVALITPGYLAMLRSPRAKPAIEAGPQ